LPLLANLAGVANWLPHPPFVKLKDAGDKSIPLHWMRLSRMVDDGTSVPVLSQGSGDLVSLGQSDGFVELPPGQSGDGPWPYYGWTR
ncbi:MAG: molybdopterin molybdotransferase MoeA, partial [Rubripirellula sp.]